MTNFKIRPQSPHLTIYKTEFTSFLSILHRVSGTILFFLFTFLLITLYITNYFLVNFFSVYYYYNLIDLILFNSIYLIIIVSFFYHLNNGIRHLTWDVFFESPSFDSLS